MNKKLGEYGTFILLAIIVPMAIVLSFKPTTQVKYKIGDFEFEYGGDIEGETIEIKKLGSPEKPTTATSPPYPPFKRYSLTSGIQAVLNEYGEVPLLPTWFPEEMKFADVYMGPVTIISFSDRKVSDFRFANITIQVKLYPNPPSLDELNKSVEYGKQQGNNDLNLVQIGDTWVVLSEKAGLGDPEVEAMFGPSPLAWFFKDNYYYIICVKSPLTPQDMIKILESLKPANQ